MSYGVVAATLPCLRIFFRSASPHFLGGHQYLEPTVTNAATAGGSGHEMSVLSRDQRKHQSLALSGNQHHTIANAAKGGEEDKVSMASDSWRRDIIVKHTVDLSYE